MQPSSSCQNNFSNAFTNTRALGNREADGTKKKLIVKTFGLKLSNEKPKTEKSPTKCWEVLQENIDAIFNDRKTNSTLEILYINVHSTCTNLTPAVVYNKLVNVIEEYTKKLKKEFDESDTFHLNEDTCGGYLQKFSKIWKIFPVKMNLVRNVFLYMDRFVVTTSNLDSEIIPIWETCMRAFRVIFFPEISSDIPSTKLYQALFLDLQKMCNRKECEKDAIRELLRMLIDVHCYEHFMDYFIMRLREHYSKMRDEYVLSKSCREYMEFCHENVSTYTNIGINYFCEPTAARRISSALVETLVAASLPGVIDKRLDDVLECQDVEIVKRTFWLCKMCPNGEEYIRNEFVRYMKEKGAKMMDTCQDDDLFNEILSFKRRMDKITEEGFENPSDPDKFRQALRDSFETFMNKKSSRSSELIARYFHSLLRTCHKKASDDNLDEMLNDAVSVFRFVHGKDMFEAFYKRDLAKRLLLDRSSSVDAEKAVLSKLKMECGAGFTHKLEGMFKDMEMSESLNKMFEQYLEHHKKPKNNMNVRVLTTECWPTYECYEICLPRELRDSLHDFTEFYKSQHSNRVLKWHYSQCTANITATFRANCKKELVGTLYHAVILLLFNNTEKWTISEIVDATKIQKAEVIRTILSLAGGRGKPQILRRCVDSSDPGSSKKETSLETIESDTFIVNNEFSEKLYRIRIAHVQIKATKEENEKVEQEVCQERQMKIDAAIVRIMKSRKELLHSQLIHETMAQLRFPVKSVDLKTRIASLIDRDYIQRSANDQNKFFFENSGAGMRTCTHCGSSDIDEDPARGDATCMSCGTVLEESIVVTENQFQERAGGSGHMLVGQFISSERAASNNFNGMGTQESREVTYAKGRKVIEEIASQLRINNHCIDTAFNFFKMCVSRNLTRGRTRVVVAAVCLYITCRLENTAHLLLDFSDVTQVNVYDLGKNLNFLTRSLKINLPSTDPCLYIIRFACLLELGEKQKEAVNLATRLVQRMKRDWMSTGRRPTGICGAALLIAARSLNFNRTINDVVKIVHISESVVRKRLEEFSQTPSGSLTIDEFSSIDLEHSEDPPAFREARRKAREEQLRKEAEQAAQMENELRPMEEQVEMALEKKRREKFSKSPFAKLVSGDVDGLAHAESKLVRDEILETVYNAADDQPSCSNSNYSHLGPSLESMGIRKAVGDELSQAPPPPQQPRTEQDDDDLISDSEIDSYILNEKEVEIKTTYWMKANGDAMKAIEERRREREANPDAKRRRRPKKSEPVVMTALDAIEKVIHERRLSNKVNYDVLKEIDSATTLSVSRTTPLPPKREVYALANETFAEIRQQLNPLTLTKLERDQSRKNRKLMNPSDESFDRMKEALDLNDYALTDGNALVPSSEVSKESKLKVAEQIGPSLAAAAEQAGPSPAPSTESTLETKPIITVKSRYAKAKPILGLPKKTDEPQTVVKSRYSKAKPIIKTVKSEINDSPPAKRPCP
ncbi:unnamed protein product [Caenorhabditis bovis]|uniref:B-related factor 1 n=1 Tax=Caenorhabditis bovis TaxID=2654633 RepID=A0A8S1EW18_9PELO|nr:unnamed protein product [Caenorhabditis bovis]